MTTQRLNKRNYRNKFYNQSVLSNAPSNKKKHFEKVKDAENQYSLSALREEIERLFRKHPVTGLLLKRTYDQHEYALDEGLISEEQYIQNMLYYLNSVKEILPV